MTTARLRFIAERILLALPTVAGVVVISFLLTRALPGDPAVYFAGPTATAESIAEIRTALGLDRSLAVQFFAYLGDLAHGDLGQSISTGQPVMTELLSRLPASLELTFLALVFSLAVAIPLGVAAATRPDGIVDQLARFVVTAGVSLPTFFTGLLLLFVFYFKLGWAPSPLGRIDIFFLPPPTVTGFYLIDSLIAGDLETFRAAFAQILLPAITLGLFTMAPIARMTRASMIAALGSDYIRTARAAGLSRRKILVGYALRNALLPVVTTLGMVFSFALGANVLVEKVFAWPGIGSYAIDGLIASDYAAVQGFVLAMALLFVLLNLVIDIVYTLLDPRIARADG